MFYKITFLAFLFIELGQAQVTRLPSLYQPETQTALAAHQELVVEPVYHALQQQVLALVTPKDRRRLRRLATHAQRMGTSALILGTQWTKKTTAILNQYPDLIALIGRELERHHTLWAAQKMRLIQQYEGSERLNRLSALNPSRGYIIKKATPIKQAASEDLFVLQARWTKSVVQLLFWRVPDDLKAQTPYLPNACAQHASFIGVFRWFDQAA